MWEFASWNVCGLRKLARHPGIFEWLLTLQVVFLQETLQVTRSFGFPGFARFDVPAIDTRGRASGGLVTLIDKRWLGNGRVEILQATCYLLLLRVTWAGAAVLLGNIYMPVHSEGCPTDIFAITVGKIEETAALHPTDAVLIGTSPIRILTDL